MNRIERFRRDECGAAMTFIVLVWLIAMLMVSGLAIDLARAEHMRVKVQNTLDRAVLAASDIDQKLDPKSVVLDYFAKAGLSSYINPADIVVDEFPGTRRKVSAVARGEIRTSTLQLSNIYTLGAPGAAAAEEAVSDIEVILVLDVSGSMEANNKIQNLKNAAKEFVDTVLANPNAGGLVSIGIVPYNGQVNARSLLPYYTVSGTRNYVDCVNFTPAQFLQTAMPPASTVLPRADYFDPWNTTKAPFPSNASRDAKMPYCPNITSREILPPTNVASVLKNHIDAYHAAGYTSLDIGMKWGAAMIDPTFRPVMQQLVAAGRVPSAFSDRPFNFRTENTAKYIILMSDGENTVERNLADAYRTGNSPIYRNSSGQLTIFHDRANTTQDWYRLNSDLSGTWATSAWSGSTQMHWLDVWKDMTIQWVVKELYSDPLSYTSTQRNNLVNAISPGVQPTTKDARTASICGAVKQAGVTVFTIAFEAPAAGITALKNCATTPNSHFFDVAGTNISTAFQIIARRISELRLTQ